MCQREGLSLQRGMNFQANGRLSIILMSRRPNAPYNDSITDNGTTLIYEGHDEPKSKNSSTPKNVDQPEFLPSGRPTENGKFHRAAQDYKAKLREAEIVRVYEKLFSGVWSYNGRFHLVDSWTEHDGTRNVFKFKLHAIEDDARDEFEHSPELNHRRIIPTNVKLEVWKRDAGQCTKCGASDELHFDHIIPYSRGGTSVTAENVQLLCARHNLQKHDRIE
ncbi:MAG: HNH endonuclease [Bdellovibrionales bacterium]|nr:HNH endonuclease [Bdellovibrionales bacterium]